jgi:hypothetical protein
MLATPEIDPTWTVTETTLRVPGTTGVFEIFGIDAGSGADLPVAEAARQAGAELQGLLEALGEAGRVSVVLDEVRRVVAELTGDELTGEELAGEEHPADELTLALC